MKYREMSQVKDMDKKTATILKFSETKIDLREIRSTKDVIFLFNPMEIDKIYKNTLVRIDKYLIKTGMEVESFFGEDTARRVSSYHLLKSLIDYVVDVIMGYYNIGGSRVMDYKRIAYKMINIIGNLREREWVKRIKHYMNMWKDIHNLDDEPLNATVLASAKIVYAFYYEGKWRRAEKEIADLVIAERRGVLRNVTMEGGTSRPR